MTSILITGGAGFIGSHYVEYLNSIYKDQEYQIIVLDKLTYAGSLSNLKNKKHIFIQGDICDKNILEKIYLQYGIDEIVNFAAETHVDNSLKNPYVFHETNILGVQTLLDFVREKNINKLVQISTDEVYGSVDLNKDPDYKFVETDRLNPSNPYSVSKAAAEMLCQVYWRTHQTPVVITRSSNNYGNNQYPEKLIPKTLSLIKQGKPAEIYGDGSAIRDWLYVTDNCMYIDEIRKKGAPGQIYNISGNTYYSVLEIVQKLQVTHKVAGHVLFLPERPGIDKKYAIDDSKLIHYFGKKIRYMTLDNWIKSTI